MAPNIKIDRERCMGSGNCSFWAPATFDLDEEGKAIVVDPDGDPLEKIEGAADGCPTLAISLEDDTRAGGDVDEAAGDGAGG